VAEVNRAWRFNLAGDWQKQHSEAQRGKRELESLEAGDALSPDDDLRRAELTEMFRGKEAALARYRELLDTENDAGGRFSIGRLLLAEKDDEGLRWLDQAMDLDPDTVLGGCLIAYEYLSESGRDAEAGAYWSRIEQQAEVFQQAVAERSQVSVDDEFEPPDLPGELLARLRETVSSYDEVGEAYLVRKRTGHLDDTHAFYVLAVVPKSSFRTAWKEADRDVEPLEERLVRDLALPGDFMVVRVGKKNPLARRLAEIEGTSLYKRG
jgi:tetratricopeptide (TPR) repeat protein